MIQNNLDNETIIAQCTPKGQGALALLRMSGSNALSIATSLSKLASKKKIKDVSTHTIHFGWIIDPQGKHIDHVMFIIMHAPQTFTGQNIVEITCHNNPFIIEYIIQQAIAHGARLAREGEFAKRAVLNNKIDLIQAEAINELIHAQTQLSLKQSLAQVEGSLSKWVITIEKILLKALTYTNASFEFIDEEITFDKQIKQMLEEIQQTIAHIKKTFNQQQHIRQGIRIAIIGSVNAGKSSLFNALLNHERAIVTNTAGTTRDAIEAGVYKNGNYWTLIDTAGLRQTNDTIEQEGIRRSFLEAQKSDIILLILDNERSLTNEERDIYENIIKKFSDKIILVNNKIDSKLCKDKPLFLSKTIPFSSTKETDTHVKHLEEKIEEKISHLFSTIESPFLLNQRQFNVILTLEKKLDDTQKLLVEPIHYELISYHLKDALEQCSELSGKSISENALDLVFREFCIGK